MDQTSTSDGVPEAGDGDPSSGFEHVVVDSEGEPTECTIFPSECPESAILTNWITARGESFVSLEDAL